MKQTNVYTRKYDGQTPTERWLDIYPIYIKELEQIIEQGYQAQIFKAKIEQRISELKNYLKRQNEKRYNYLE